MPTTQALSDLVTINYVLVGLNPQSASFAVPMIAAEFTASGWGALRAQVFSGTSSQILGDLVTSGIAAGDPIYVAVREMFGGRPSPSSVVIGRRDAADADWETALTAIKATADTLSGGGFYAFCLADERTAAGILSAATWAKGETVLYIAQTADADVYNEVADNLAASLHAVVDNRIGVGRTALLWHDPQTASGGAAPTVSFAPTNAALTWDLRAASGSRTLNMQVDGGAEEIATVSALPATVTGTNTGPVSLVSGNVLTLTFDGGSALTTTFTAASASVTAPIVEDYDLSGSSGEDIEVVTDTGTITYALFSGAAPGDDTAVTAAEVAADFVAAVTGTIATASASGGYPTFESITKGTNARFYFGGGTFKGFLDALGLTTTQYAGTGNVKTITAVTIDEAVGLVNTAIAASGTASNSSNALKLDGTLYGTDGALTVAGTAGLLTAFGLTAATTAGTGNVPNAATVTPLQLEPILDSAYSSDVTVDVVPATGVITITGATGVGYWRTLRFVGSLREPLGITRDLIRGAGVADDYSDAQAIGARASIDIDSQGLTGWAFTPLRGAYGDSIPQNRSVSLRESADVNTVEARSPTASYAALQSGRLCTRLDTGEPVYVDALIGIDWLGVRIQEALVRMLESAAEAGVSIDFTDKAARPAILAAITPPIELAATQGVVAEADLTPPDSSINKITGVTIDTKAEISSTNLTKRFWQITVTLAGAGKLQGLVVNLNVSNA